LRVVFRGVAGLRAPVLLVVAISRFSLGLKV
jgi:hypothetical protein